MIRVLHFADIINRHDFIHNVMAHCDPERIAMTAVTMTARGTLNASCTDIPLKNLDVRHRSLYALAIWRLRSLLCAERVDVLHSHHFEPTFLAVLALVGTGAKLVIGRHYSDSIHKQASGMGRHVYLAIETFCNRRARHIVVPSRFVEDVLISQGVPRTRIARIPYGFDFSRLTPSSPEAVRCCASLWGNGPGLRLATFGRCHREKGHRVLLTAVRSLLSAGVAVQWLIVGDGPDRLDLERDVAAAGIGAVVRFAGWRRDVPDVMAAADIVVQPTLGEAFSQVMVEAMAMGRPLVISDVGGVADVVQHGQSGLVVPPGDPAALVAAVRLLASEKTRAAFGEGAHARVRSMLGIRQIAAQFDALYESVKGE